MTDLMQKAVERIDKEADNASPALKIIAQHIIDNFIVSDSAAEKILSKNKNLSGCYKAIEDKARKQAVKNTACIDHQTVYAWAQEYFDLTSEDLKRKESKKANILSFDIFGD